MISWDLAQNWFWKNSPITFSQGCTRRNYMYLPSDTDSIILYHFSNKYRKNIYSSNTQVTFEIYGHLICLLVLYSKWTYLPSIVLLGRLWNPLRKAVPVKFHVSGGHIQCNCLHDLADIYRSRAWKIFLILTLISDEYQQESRCSPGSVSIISWASK